MQDCQAQGKGGAPDCACPAVPLVVEGLVRCLCGADDRSDWTARLAAAGRAAITVRSLLLELRALPNLTDAMMSSAASSILQHPVHSTFPLGCDSDHCTNCLGCTADQAWFHHSSRCAKNFEAVGGLHMLPRGHRPSSVKPAHGMGSVGSLSLRPEGRSLSALECCAVDGQHQGLT